MVDLWLGHKFFPLDVSNMTYEVVRERHPMIGCIINKDNDLYVLLTDEMLEKLEHETIEGDLFRYDMDVPMTKITISVDREPLPEIQELINNPPPPGKHVMGTWISYTNSPDSDFEIIISPMTYTDFVEDRMMFGRYGHIKYDITTYDNALLDAELRRVGKAVASEYLKLTDFETAKRLVLGK
jgi:hypothetical protein